MSSSARLVSIAGPVRGNTFALDEEFSIGRDGANRLTIDDRHLSRRHCIIRKEKAHYKIVDLDSRNGTFVNSFPIRERDLQDHDQIGIGKSLFFFVVDEAELSAQLSATARSIAALVDGDTLGFEETRCNPAPVRAVRPAEDLNALVKISDVVSSACGSDGVKRRILEALFQLIPAERGAVVFFDHGRGSAQSLFPCRRTPDGIESLQAADAQGFDLAELKRMLNVNNSRAVAIGNNGSQPLMTGGTAALAAPLIEAGQPFGAIYIDTTDTRIHFDAADLQLTEAIARLASVALENASRIEQLEAQTQLLTGNMDGDYRIVGESPAIRDVFRFIAKAAPSDSTVLIAGESGTGKELVARALHRNSRRSARPFVAINCAALVEALLESELFGHERGAFTGAIAQKKGKLEIADGGTVFLDEIGELTPLLQAKLLRVLQEHEFERVGATHTQKVDIRVIAATNRDLDALVAKGTFRQDLYYRLNVISIAMPPLKDRREDIPLLARHFLAKHGKNSPRHVTGISLAARNCLMNYSWPGNARELENAIEHALVLGSSDVVLPEDLPEAVLEAQTDSAEVITNYHTAVKSAKQQLVRQALERAKNDHKEAAKLLGVHPNYLYRLIRNLAFDQVSSHETFVGPPGFEPGTNGL